MSSDHEDDYSALVELTVVSQWAWQWGPWDDENNPLPDVPGIAPPEDEK